MVNREACPACFEALGLSTGLPIHTPSLAKETGSTGPGGLNKEPEIKVRMEAGIPLNSSPYVGAPGFFKAQWSLEKFSFSYRPHVQVHSP